MNHIIEILKSKQWIGGLKTLQPFASWIVSGKKTIDIRTYDTKTREVIGILASGTHPYFIDLQSVKEMVHFALIGFVRIETTKKYRTKTEFDREYAKHCNPSAFWDDEEEYYGWILSHPIIIQPIFYTHKQNEGKDTIPLSGNYARVRILTEEILDRIEVIE